MSELKDFTELEIIEKECSEGAEYDEANVPYFCKHSENQKYNSYSGYGRMIKTGSGFTLVDIGLEKQNNNDCTSVQTASTLRELVDRWNVKRIKGKIILFVEKK